MLTPLEHALTILSAKSQSLCVAYPWMKASKLSLRSKAFTGGEMQLELWSTTDFADMSMISRGCVLAPACFELVATFLIIVVPPILICHRHHLCLHFFLHGKWSQWLCFQWTCICSNRHNLALGPMHQRMHCKAFLISGENSGNASQHRPTETLNCMHGSLTNGTFY